LEHKDLWTTKGFVPEGDDHLIPLGKARIARSGKDITIVAWSRMALLATAAADELGMSGIEAEVIDLRTLWPWDLEAVLTSVRKTGRLFVPQETVQVGGFAAEIIAEVIDKLGETLKYPPKRIGAPRIPVPYSPPLEDEYRVTEKDIVAAVKAMFTQKS
jgi:pyruvate dehydrogenase E1 component beta subunit